MNDQHAHEGLEAIDVESRKTGRAGPKHGFSTQKSVFDKMEGVAIQGYDRDRCVTYWNSASEQVYGYGREEAIGRKLEDLIIPEVLREKVVNAIQNWYDHGVSIPAGELTLVGKEGSPVYVHSATFSHGICPECAEKYYDEMKRDGVVKRP